MWAKQRMAGSKDSRKAELKECALKSGDKGRADGDTTAPSSGRGAVGMKAAWPAACHRVEVRE